MEKQKKRVLIFSLVYYPRFVGGAEVAVKEITDRLGDEIEFDMVTLRLDAALPRFERIGKVNVYRVGFTLPWFQNISAENIPPVINLNKYLMPITASIKALLLMRKKRYDIFWSLLASYQAFAALFLKMLLPRKKFLLTLQEGDPISYIKKRAALSGGIYNHIFTYADTIQTISNYLARFAHEMNAKCPVIVVPNGVDVDFFTRAYTEDEINAEKKRIGKKEGEISLITTSRLVEKNNIANVISALPLLPKEVVFYIAGNGPLFQNLKEQALLLGLEERVRFLGFISHKDLPLLLKASDVFIRTPHSEGFGNSYIEAMATGLPCIASEVGGIGDFLKDGETGLFASPKHPETVAEAVQRLMKDEDLVTKIKRNALEMVRQKYSWSLISEEMHTIFKNL